MGSISPLQGGCCCGPCALRALSHERVVNNGGSPMRINRLEREGFDLCEVQVVGQFDANGIALLRRGAVDHFSETEHLLPDDLHWCCHRYWQVS